MLSFSHKKLFCWSNTKISWVQIGFGNTRRLVPDQNHVLLSAALQQNIGNCGNKLPLLFAQQCGHYEVKNRQGNQCEILARVKNQRSSFPRFQKFWQNLLKVVSIRTRSTLLLLDVVIIVSQKRSIQFNYVAK